jgi:hypothetical protein
MYGSTLEEQGGLSRLMAIGSQFGVMIAAAGFKKIGRHQIQLIVATGFMTAFAGALTTTTPSTKAKASAFAFFAGLGTGYVEPMTCFITQVQRGPNEIGLATDVVGFFRSLGGGVATSILPGNPTNKVSKAEQAYVIKAALENGLHKTSLPASTLRGYSSRYGVSIYGCPGHHSDNNWNRNNRSQCSR